MGKFSLGTCITYYAITVTVLLHASITNYVVKKIVVFIEVARFSPSNLIPAIFPRCMWSLFFTRQCYVNCNSLFIVVMGHSKQPN